MGFRKDNYNTDAFSKLVVDLNVEMNSGNY